MNDEGAVSASHALKVDESSPPITLFGWLALLIFLIGDAISGKLSTSTSVTALITGVLVIIALLLLFPTWLFSNRPSVRRALLPLAIFLVWAFLVTALFHHFDREGLQNLAVYVLFFSTIAIVVLSAEGEAGPGSPSSWSSSGGYGWRCTG